MATRYKIVTDIGTSLTSGRVPIVSTGGRLTDDADMTFVIDTLTATKISTTLLTSSGSIIQQPTTSRGTYRINGQATPSDNTNFDVMTFTAAASSSGNSGNCCGLLFFNFVGWDTDGYVYSVNRIYQVNCYKFSTLNLAAIVTELHASDVVHAAVTVTFSTKSADTTTLVLQALVTYVKYSTFNNPRAAWHTDFLSIAGIADRFITPTSA